MWASGTQVEVTIEALVDGRTYFSKARSSGGIRSANGVEYAAYKLHWNLPSGYFDGSTGKRLGETGTTFQCRIRFELLRGTTLTSSVVVTSGSAPLNLPPRHNSVAFVASESAVDESGDGFHQFSLDAGSSANRAAFVTIGARGTSLAGTIAVDGGGETFGSALWDVADGGTSSNARAYAVTGLASGTRQFTSDLTAASSQDHFLGVVTLSGVNQASPTGNVQTIGPVFDASPVSVTVTGMVAADMVLDYLQVSAAPTVGANQTERENPANTSFPTYYRLSTQSGADGGAMSWTHASDTTRFLGAVVFKAQPTAALTGTATASITESDVVAGGKTVIVTLTDDTFVSDTNFPTVEATAESSVNTAGTSHTVTLPAGMVSTDLILITMDIGSTSATLNALTDWTELLDESAANGLKIIYYTGSGVPSNPTFTSSASTRSASIAWRISKADKTIAPEIGTTATGTSATPDPPASATPGSTKNYLFIAFYGAAGEEADDDTWSDTPPTNYGPTPPLQKACGTAGTNLGGMIAAAHRQLNTGSAENPGTFAKDVSAAWRAQTIMIHPELQFTNARAAIRDGVDSAQSEANGWDSLKSTTMPVANVVRTSDTVCTITLAAAGSYNITAQETITVTLPSTSLAGGAAVVATPTFTIDTAGAAAGAIPPFSRHPMAHLLVR